MKVESRGHTFDIAPNSKPYLLKRMISDGFDIVTLLFVFVLLSNLISASPLGETFRSHLQACSDIQKQVSELYPGNSEAIREALSASEVYRNELFAVELHGFLLKVLAAFISEAVLFLAIPLLSAKRTTLGKKMTGISLFSERTQGRASKLQVFYRFMFTFMVESVLAYPWTGLYTFLLIPVIRITVMMLNRNNKTICDYVTSTMLIEDMSFAELR
ncbi:MAG: RDD family protein [Erysipelotrichaceae bacterium]|nr:RDD family protein [Erysipelotrichaceae bacterium]